MFLSRCASTTGIDFSELSWRWFKPRRSFGPLLPARMPNQPSLVKARNVLSVGKLYSNYSSRGDRSEKWGPSWGSSWLLLSPNSPHHDRLAIFLSPLLPMFMQLALRTVRDNSFISCCPPSLQVQILQQKRFDIVLDQPHILHTPEYVALFASCVRLGSTSCNLRLAFLIPGLVPISPSAKVAPITNVIPRRLQRPPRYKCYLVSFPCNK